MKKTDICDKCGKEKSCTIEEYACISEKDKIPEKKKEKYSTIIRFLASVTCRLCDECAKKRKRNYLLVALLFFTSSLPFFIWWIYLEFGFTLLVLSAMVLYLSSNGHEMEYLAKMNYRKSIEGIEGAMLNPRIIKKARWDIIKKDPVKFNSTIIEEEKTS